MSYVTGIKHEGNTTEENVVIHGEQHEPTSSTIVLQDEQVEVPTVMKKRRRHYKQLYRSQWQRMPLFAGWLRPVRHDLRKARCLACKSTMVAEITVIKNHAKGKRHLKNLHQSQNDAVSVLFEEIQSSLKHLSKFKYSGVGLDSKFVSRPGCHDII